MKVKEMRKKIKLQRNLLTVFATSTALLVIAIVALGFSLFDFGNKYDKLNQDYTDLQSTSLTESIQKDAQIQQLQSTIQQLDSELQQVSDVNKSYVDELNELRSRQELYNKYEYAVLDEEGKRTDLTYEQIKLGEELMEENGYNPHLLFGTIMVESNGNPYDVNSQTGATGYGQFLDETARFTWVNLLNNNYYDPDIRKDGTSNIKMMASYYDYLYNKVGTTFNVVKCYSGNSEDSGAQSYLNRINKYTSKVGAFVN